MIAPSLEFVIPGDLAAATGGYEYDRRIIEGLRQLGWRVTVGKLDGSYPDPTAQALKHAESLFAQLPAQSLVLVDGLAGGTMPDVLQRHASRLCLVALVHHPLAAESGLDSGRVAELRRSETLALGAVRHVVATSQATLRGLEAYGVHSGRASVIEPGTDFAPRAGRPRGGTLNLLCVATLIPRKGHDILIAALAALHSSAWQLTCVGSLAPSPATVERLRQQIQREGLGSQVVLAGQVPPAVLERFYRETDLVVLPTRFEGYGMAIAEALAHGVPVISTPTGAIAEMVGAKAGILVGPDDTHALRAALASVMHEPDVLASLTAGATAAGGSLPGWEQSCARMSQVLGAMLPLQNASDRGR